MLYKNSKKIAAALLFAMSVQACVSAEGIKQSPKIKNVSVDTFDGVIKWEYDGEYAGAEVYKLTSGGDLTKFGETADLAIKYDGDGAYLVRAVNADNNDYGSLISYSEEKTFSLAVSDYAVSNGSASLNINVTNNTDGYSGGVLNVGIYDIDGESVGECRNGMTVRGGATEAVRLSLGTSDRQYKTVISFWDGETKKTDLAEPITIVKENPGEEYVTALIAENNSRAAELLGLIDECRAKEIPVDYEYADYKILESFSEYLREDLDAGELGNIYYTENALGKIYEKTKSNLTAYLNGEKTAVSVPKFTTGERRIEGQTVYAPSQTDGANSGERPTYFVGYGHFSKAIDDIAFFEDIGINTVQVEIGPSDAMLYTPDFDNWETGGKGSPVYEISQDNAIYKEGTSSVKIVTSSENTGAVTLTQKVAVEPGKKYIFTAYVRSATKATQISLSVDGFASDLSLNGRYDMKKFGAEYTAPEGAEYTTVGFRIAGSADINIDSVSFTEENGTENLLKNGSFENKSELAYSFDEFSDNVKKVRNALEESEKHNVAVELLLSPHYFPQKIIDMYGIGLNNSTAFIKYIIDAPQAKGVVERFMRGMLSIAAEYSSLSSICISNEPSYELIKSGDYYLKEWREFLKTRYDGDIDKLKKAYGISAYSSFDEIDYKYIWLHVTDYVDFISGIFSAWHEWMADIARKEAPDIPVHAKIIDYLPTGNSKSVDALRNGTKYEFYGFQDLNGCDASNVLTEDKRYLRELLWFDYIRSIHNAPIINSEDHIINNGSKDYNADVADYVAQGIYMGAIHGRAISDIWVWERSYEPGSDFNDSVLFRPDCISAISRTTMDLNRNAYYIQALSEKKADVGILYSDSSIQFDTTAQNSLYQAYAACIYNGERADFIVPSQLEKLNAYRAVIVPDVKYAGAETLTALSDYVASGGRVIFMGGECLRYDDKKSANDKAEIESLYKSADTVEYTALKNGILSSTEEELYSEIRTLLKNYGLYRIEVRDVATGKPVNYVEYNVGEYDGKTVINLLNYEDKKTVNIYVNGKKVTEAYNIITNEPTGENVTLCKYIPVTLTTAE